jgi:hypothetical protein
MEKRTITNPWYELALHHGKTHQTFTEIKPDSAQYFAWQDYFKSLCWFPIAFRMMSDTRQARSWTAPCEWPDDLKIELPAGDRQHSHEQIREYCTPAKEYTEDHKAAMRKKWFDLVLSWGAKQRSVFAGADADRIKAERAIRYREADQQKMKREYDRLQQAPIYAGDMLVSPELAEKLAVPR